MEIIAHRGAAGSAPENTLVSVRLAWKYGADAVEIDVHLTKDNRIVVIHDHTTKRTAGTDLEIKSTVSGELRKLDVGRFRGEEFTGEKIPFFEEVVTTIPSNRRLFVEIKSDRKILPILQSIITKSDKMSQIVVVGFDLETMSIFKKAMPEIPVYWLHRGVQHEKTNHFFPYDPKFIQIAKDLGLDGLDVFYAGVAEDFVNAVKLAGLKLYVWTVDDVDAVKRMQKLGVAGITTDRPNVMIEQLQEGGE